MEGLSGWELEVQMETSPKSEERLAHRTLPDGATRKTGGEWRGAPVPCSSAAPAFSRRGISCSAASTGWHRTLTHQDESCCNQSDFHIIPTSFSYLLILCDLICFAKAVVVAKWARRWQSSMIKCRLDTAVTGL